MALGCLNRRFTSCTAGLEAADSTHVTWKLDFRIGQKITKHMTFGRDIKLTSWTVSFEAVDETHITWKLDSRIEQTRTRHVFREHLTFGWDWKLTSWTSWGSWLDTCYVKTSGSRTGQKTHETRVTWKPDFRLGQKTHELTCRYWGSCLYSIHVTWILDSRLGQKTHEFNYQ